ncbi:Phosphoinositide phosphatase sac1 [Thecaphora frezii]
MTSSKPLVWDALRLYTSQDAYTFQSTASPSDTFTIDRNDAAIRVGIDGARPNPTKTMTVHGILGLIKLHTTEFLVIITSRQKVAEILGADVFMATDFRVLPVNREADPSILRHPVEKTLLGLLKSHLYSAPFYFSYAYDLTSSLQRQSTVVDADPAQPLWKRADDRFFWNRYLQTRLIDHTLAQPSQDLSRFILPCVFGFLEVKSAAINGRNFVLGLIARRSRHRVGTRYFSRGIDENGNVSNFNETEQFVIVNPAGDAGAVGGKVEGKIRMSYIQTRGSVPVFWAEINNLRYKPDLQIMDRPETAEATRRHFEDQVARYGDVYLVNLVNQKGYEKPVKEAYERVVDQLNNPQVHYTYYDFHHECKGMKFERVMDLIDRLHAKGVESDDYFHHDTTRQGQQVVRRQKSVVRTNCMDCLDRTNVVQGTLARWVLNDQLRAVGVLSSDDRVEAHESFMHMYRNVWADHADVVSKAYSGTGALKTDFTRTGKRTKEGALQDGLNSITRYVKNNFYDGARQDAYDLFTGAWQPSRGLPHIDRRALTVRAMPWVFFFSVAMVVAALVLPRHSTAAATVATVAGTTTGEVAKHHHWFLILWSTVTVASFYYMVARGLDYVSWPMLNRPDQIIFYDGPGFRSGRNGRDGVVNPLVGAPSSSSSAAAGLGAGTNAYCVETRKSA